MKLTRFFSVPTLAAVAALGIQSVSAQVATPPVGFNAIDCPSGSDTYVSVAFNRSAAFVGVVNSVNVDEITPSGTLAWTADQFVSPEMHFLKVRTGTKAGAWYTITTNATGSVTVALGGDTLDDLAPGDEIAVIPFATLSTIFPPGNPTIHVSTGTSSFARKTQILFPNPSGSGVNLTPSGIYYLTAEGWRDALSGNALVNPVLGPDTFMIIRHRAADPATTFTAIGEVDLAPVQTVLTTLTGGSTDHPVSNLRPVPVRLADLGLIASGAFVGSAGTSSFARKDTLFVFDNAATGVNKTPQHVYYFDSNAGSWKDALNGNAVSDDDLIEPSTGYIIRKVKTNDGASAVWTHSFTSN